MSRGKPGWQLTCSPEEFLEDLRIYGALLDRYPNVIGGCAYTSGNDKRWEKYAIEPIWERVVSEYPAEEPPDGGDNVAVPLKIDGRSMTVAEFKTYVESINLGRVDRVVMHHTAAPSEAQWRQVGWDGRKANMAYFYGVTKGWDKGPHLFVWYDEKGIGLFWDISRDGYGVSGWNDYARHIEQVGNWMIETPNPATLTNSSAAAAILLYNTGHKTDVDTALTYHRKLTPGVTECPGDKFVAQWAQFVQSVKAKMAELYPPPKGLTEEEARLVMTQLGATIAYIQERLK